MNRTTTLVAVVAAVAAMTTSCSSSGGTRVAVRSTNDACQVAETKLDAGELRFEVTNDGREPTELYVLGDNDRVISEVENIGPGTSRTLGVSLKAGTYTLACKPGQRGDGIRQTITVTGTGGQQGVSATADKDVSVTALDYAFSFESPPSIGARQSIAFRLTNNGTEDHEFEVLAPDGSTIGEITEVRPGGSGEAVISFAEAGSYTYRCQVKAADGQTHDLKGMRGTFTVR